MDGPWTEITLAGIEKALEHGGGTHTVGDVCRQILEGNAQLHESENALIVTEIYNYPRQRTVHFWLATGDMAAVIDLSHHVLEWAREQDCTHATLSGRRGWGRVLKSEGWEPMLTVMGREV